MKKYIHLVLSILSALSAVAIVAYGLYVDRMHILVEGAMYAVVTVILLYFYKEAKQREIDGI